MRPLAQSPAYDLGDTGLARRRLRDRILKRMITFAPEGQDGAVKADLSYASGQPSVSLLRNGFASRNPSPQPPNRRGLDVITTYHALARGGGPKTAGGRLWATLRFLVHADVRERRA